MQRKETKQDRINLTSHRVLITIDIDCAWSTTSRTVGRLDDLLTRNERDTGRYYREIDSKAGRVGLQRQVH